MGIESVVEGKNGDRSGGLHDAMCSSCEMAVVWMQTNLDRTKHKIVYWTMSMRWSNLNRLVHFC